MRNPFIAGSWVGPETSSAAATSLRDVLEGERDSLWVVGARRLGKTSLLKELEYRVQESRETPFAALYWDLQGSADARGLADNLLGSVEDSESFRRASDVSVESLEGLPVADMLTTLIRRTVRSGWRLLLLVDEAEEFLTVARTDAGVLPRLRRVFQKGPEVRTVLTSTKRLARIDERTDIATSPFLQGFIPPLYLTPLADDGVPRSPGPRPLRRRRRPSSSWSGRANHPFLVQLIASRLFESHDSRPPSTRWPPTRWWRTSSRSTSRPWSPGSGAPRGGRPGGAAHPQGAGAPGRRDARTPSSPRCSASR